MDRRELGRNVNKFSLPAAVALGGTVLWQYSKIRALKEQNRQLDNWLGLMLAANEKLQHEATHDKLTGLLNRAGLEATLSKSRRPVAFLYVDGTNQKAVNDLISHDRGDEAIVGTAQVITRSLREQDIAARIGGDEFLVILNPEARSEGETLVRQPQEVLDTVMHRMGEETSLYLDANPDLVEKAGFNIAVGGAIWQTGMTIDDLRKDAEAHMYLVKAGQHQASGQYRSVN